MHNALLSELPRKGNGLNNISVQTFFGKKPRPFKERRVVGSIPAEQSISFRADRE